ncbi:uncharacterized protein A4U43_C06F2990 [Asparagus officinalis]|uniref:Uncharacterized protein n=1 Tax=Asparagus officinalis TaxID=4686 RepID=A0A5P1EJN2_ASPOF|nr:uncharacterized protein A4U43_C06F2990 [Asparagus officinalis]
MVAAASAAEKDAALGPALATNGSFTFQLADIAHDEASLGFKEMWPQKGFVRWNTIGHCGQEAEPSLHGVLKEHIANFRRALELPPFNDSVSLHEFLRNTLEDLLRTYPKCGSCIQISEVNHGSTHQVLFYFYKALKSVGDLWAQNHSQNFAIEKDVYLETLSFHKLVEKVLERLNYMSSRAKEMFDLMDNHQGKYSSFGSPLTPTSVLPPSSGRHSNPKELSVSTCLSSHIQPMRLQALAKLKPLDMKRLSFRMLPLIVDQKSIPMHQKHKIDGEQKLDPVQSVTVESNADTKSDPESRSYEVTALTHSSPNTHQETSMESMPHDTNKHDIISGDINRPSEATILIAPPTIPLMHLRAPSHQSETPTPPSTPMVLQGVYMPFFDSSMNMEPVAYAMTIDNFQDYFMNDMDTENNCKPSEASLSATPPPTPTPELREPPTPKSPIPPPPPPPSQSKLAPMPPPLPPPIKSGSPSQLPLPSPGIGSLLALPRHSTG